ncbi:ArpU family phage packaging/lysis transcriptional regulator [Lactiplantibacillus nangangensis]|uniref:ArpU family phage packaging/lysis transcriptional regulator n=1 Tax=Lactiplantibacillus nangangensis TaxID=2559917 RepID=A0ABW1SLW2_9LACO|nr:ArpU family phage packaging/lysis transcriptional regulator [Lactiplantibacillus nangangensis]
MESIFKGVDKERTIVNADRVLNSYRKWRLRAQRVSFNLQSPAMDGMPKSPSYGNSIEDKHVNKSNADFMANLVIRVIDAITIDEGSEIYSKLLTLLYIKHYSKTKCMVSLNISDKTFNKYLKQAQLTFAEIYPDKVENLIVKKYEPEPVARYDEG